VPGLGLFGLGRSKKARIAADLATSAITTITNAEAINLSRFPKRRCSRWNTGARTTSSACDELPLAGQVAAITGAGVRSDQRPRRHLRSGRRSSSARCR
jgi:hypothetical protein